MAAAKAKNELLPMTCCLGDHPLQNPRLLPCQHSFCTQCIKNDIGKEKKMFVCPKCQLSIPLTEKDVAQLPEDVLYHVLQETEDNADCVLCKFQDKKTPGTFQCLDCADVLCSQCQVGHTMSTHTRLHRVVSQRDVQQGNYKNEIQAEKQLLCDTHSKPNKPMVLEYYCEQCKCLVCQLCGLRDHVPQGHTCNAIDEIHGEKVRDVSSQVTLLVDLKCVVEEFAAVLEQQLEQNKEHQDKVENEIHDKAATFIDMIEKVKEETLEKIKGHFDKENTSIQSTLGETRNRIIRIDSLVTYTQDLLKHSTKSQFLQHVNKTRHHLTEQRQHMMQRSLKINFLDIDEPGLVLSEASITEAFGKLNFRPRKVEGAIKKKILRKSAKEPKVLFCNVSCPGKAFDVSVTESEDIVTVGGSIIQMYSKDGNPKEKKTCNMLRDAWNVVAKGDNLFVSDRLSLGQVFEMDFCGNVKKTISLPTVTNVGHKGLAIDDDGNVYISSFYAHTVYKSEPSEKNAKVFIQKGTHPDLKGPMYLCVTPGGELVVSNRDSNAVQLYNRQGEFLWQYKGQGDMMLKQPRGICCDRASNIYISDFLNNRIQVIKDEVFQRCIKLTNIHLPRCLDIDANDDVVCGYADGEKIAKIQIWE